MIRKFVMLSFVVLAGAGCTPLVVGGAAAVGADAIIEAENGGDGLF